MREFLLIAHIMMAFGVIALILLQHGKGADTGAAFGGGASGTVFGARGSASFLSRLTAGLAVLFFSNSLLLAYLAANQKPVESLMQRVQAERRVDQGLGDTDVARQAEDLPPPAVPEERGASAFKTELPGLPPE